MVGFDGSDDAILDRHGEIEVARCSPWLKWPTQAAIQADLYIRTGSTGKPEKQTIDMVLLTPQNACQYTVCALPNGKTSCPSVPRNVLDRSLFNIRIVNTGGGGTRHHDC